MFDNTFTLTNEQIRQLLDREFYINIHSDNNPSGEIRGQLLSKQCEYFISSLSGNNEDPPILSNGTGTILFELNNNVLTVSGSSNSLNNIIIAGHIHLAPPGNTGPIIFQLSLDINGTSAIIHAQNNVFTLTCEQIRILKAGQYYVNIHTVTSPAGEIRGQIVKL